MLKKNKLSIIIVNYNVDSLVLKCIKSIYDINPKIQAEIIVVDNSEINSLEKKLIKVFRSVKYIKPPKNLGYGEGINLGVGHASGEYLFILNPDTKLFEGRITFLIDFIKNKNKVGLVAPIIVDKEGNPIKQGARILTPLRAIFSLSILSKIFQNNKILQKYSYSDWDRNETKQVDVVPGTAFMVKKDIYEKINGFDEKIFLYFEEFDLCKRLVNKGYRNYIFSDVKFFHQGGASTRLNKNKNKYFKESRYYYFKKHFGVLMALITEIILNINKYILALIILIIFVLIIIFLR